MLKTNGQRRGSHSIRTVNTKMHAELLVGDQWYEVAYAELMRLSLEVNAYHTQLTDEPGFEETSQAFEALQSACRAIAEKYGQDGDQGGQGDMLK